MYHSITILGNLGKDPEMRFTPSGSAVCSFSVATSRSYTKNEEKVKETVWFRVTTWGKLAEICNEYLKKGSKVLVVGRLIPDLTTGGPRTWEASDGSTKASFEINAQEVKFLSPKGVAKETSQDDNGVDEIPF